MYSERAWDKRWLHILANGVICVPTDCTVTINWGLVLGGTGTTGTVICKPPRPSARVDATQNATEGSGGGGSQITLMNQVFGQVTDGCVQPERCERRDCERAERDNR